MIKVHRYMMGLDAYTSKDCQSFLKTLLVLKMAWRSSNQGYGGRSKTVVYTDGSCKNNGYEGARAGYGVYWGEDDDRNVSGRVSGRQTNNRAEIKAATKAVQQAKESGIRDLEVRTDSEFLIKCQNGWVDNWQDNGWRTASGGEVKNREELQELNRELSSGDVNVDWKHVRGHQGDYGNEAADRLALAGASQRRK